jgi:hypothetical protein
MKRTKPQRNWIQVSEPVFTFPPGSLLFVSVYRSDYFTINAHGSFTGKCLMCLAGKKRKKRPFKDIDLQLNDLVDSVPYSYFWSPTNRKSSSCIAVISCSPILKHNLSHTIPSPEYRAILPNDFWDRGLIMGQLGRKSLLPWDNMPDQAPFPLLEFLLE